MEKKRWQKIEQIVDVALEIEDKKERTNYINEKCKSDDALIQEVNSFIDSIEASDGLWDDLLNSNRAVAEEMYTDFSKTQRTESENSPEIIGPYRIKKKIAQGGMGNIYLAERMGGKFHKKVAIKIIRKEIDSRITIQRFIQERSILSSLNHPNIAKLLDGGVTEDGRPYFVMEFIDGEPITEYFKNSRFDLMERLSLFANACRAVQYAHSNFVVHRDLKPSNILVTKEGDLKILDFGIAKLTDGKLTNQTLIETRAGYRMLSLNYAAPEQINGEPVTTATDVYALGLLLFELITESKAFDLRDKNLIETEKMIREYEPAKPSSYQVKWRDKLKGDLDAIVMKSIRKEQGERYESARHLLEDLQRYTKNIPVKARKGTARYKASKFIKRNKTILASLTALVLIVTSVSVLYAYRINQEKMIAQSEAQKADQVTNFLIELFQSADPYSENSQFGLDTSIGTILENGMINVDLELNDQPEVRAAVKDVIGGVYFSLGEFDTARELFLEAIDIALENGQEGNRGLPVYYFHLGKISQSLGEFERADSLLSLSINLFENTSTDLISSEYVAALSLYGNFLWFNKGDFEEAEVYLQRSLEQRLQHFSESDYMMAPVYNDLATLNHAQGKFKIAVGYYENAIERYARLDSLSPSVAISMANFSMLLRERGNLSDAEYYQNRALDIVTTREDQHQIDIALGKGNLSEIQMLQGNYEVADSLARESIHMLKNLFGEVHPYVARTELILGMNYFKRGNLEEAESLLHKVYEDYKSSYPEGHPRLGDPVFSLGKYYKAMGDMEAAKDYFSLAYDLYYSGYGFGNPKTGEVMVELGEIYSAEGDHLAADTLISKGFDILQESLHHEDNRISTAEIVFNRHQERVK